jgi:hypothetical protein
MFSVAFPLAKAQQFQAVARINPSRFKQELLDFTIFRKFWKGQIWKQEFGVAGSVETVDS